jgi:hypothetical protein
MPAYNPSFKKTIPTGRGNGLIPKEEFVETHAAIIDGVVQEVPREIILNTVDNDIRYQEVDKEFPIQQAIIDKAMKSASQETISELKKQLCSSKYQLVAMCNKELYRRLKTKAEGFRNESLSIISGIMTQRALELENGAFKPVGVDWDLVGDTFSGTAAKVKPADSE